MLKYIISILIVLLYISGMAQEYNQKDDQGREQGAWQKYHEGTEQLFYKGQFKDGIKVGVWQYFYKDGVAKAEMRFSASGKVSHSTIFDVKGRKMAFGKYIEKKKDSTWTYFDVNGAVSSVENWKNGSKHGQAESFLPDGTLIETVSFEDGMRNGPFKEFYDNGKVRREGTYQMDDYEGQMTFYFPNGRKEIEGKYVNGQRESTWRYYNDDGSIHYQVVHRQGEIVLEKKENGVFREFAPNNALVSEINYKKGLKDGPYTLYYEEVEKILKEVSDPRTGETYWKEVPVGNGIKEEGQYKADFLHGTIKHYNEVGKLVKTEQYEMGELK